MYVCTYVCKSRYFHLVREGKGREAECKGKGIGIGKGKGKRCWVRLAGWLVGWLVVDGWITRLTSVCDIYSNNKNLDLKIIYISATDRLTD